MERIVKGKKSPDLAGLVTTAPESVNREEIEAEMEKLVDETRELQQKLYAESKHALLIVFQGMDGAGKDSLVRNVIGKFDPQGIRVTSFKDPSETELQHDFLWRIHKAVPEHGEIGVFNRSYYEQVLIVKVDRLQSEEEVEKNYAHINNFEALLKDYGTHILKFFLHISKEEQARRMEERKTSIRKKWKYDESDDRKRRQWSKYQEAYETVFRRCASDEFPWHIIPADDKWYRNYLVMKAINRKLTEMNPKYPNPRIK